MKFERKILTVLPIAIALLLVTLNIKATIPLTIFLMLWMVIWWVFEIMPLGVTALIPLFYLPFTGVMPLKEVAPQYSNPVIYLFLGGFIIARALEKTRLNERIALLVLKLTGTSDKGIVAGFIIATAFLSMWISNTATTVMMVPIAMSVLEFLKENVEEGSRKLILPMSTVMFLGIAYAANIGGIMTPIGTPPNVVFVGYLDELFQTKIEFYEWFLITAPTGIVVMALMFLLLIKLFPFNVPIDNDFKSFILGKIKELGKVNSEQKVTLIVFSLVACLWIFKGVIHYLIGRDLFNDTSIAILGGVLLFVLPTKHLEWTPVLDKDDIPHLPWNIVLLFGGGMAMANSLKEAGLIQIATDYFATLEVGSVYFLVFTLAALALFLTEIMSNVALCVVALPVIMNLGEGIGLSAIEIALPATLCASFAFSMPISTPPNAIVFGTNRLKVGDMMKAGIPLNILSVITVMTVSWYLMKLFV